MTSPAIERFNQQFAQSPEFRQQIREIESLPQLLAILKTWDCELSGPELVTLAQEAYQTWLDSLDPTLQPFFIEAHNNKSLNQAIETCKTPQDAIALAKNHGFTLSETDLQAAATAAENLEGFSFEKLWFKGLGLIK